MLSSVKQGEEKELAVRQAHRVKSLSSIIDAALRELLARRR
jgi:hypothetical protein